MPEKCGIVVSRQFQMCGIHSPGEIGGEKSTYIAECIRPEHSSETHLVRTPDGRYFAWKKDYTCDCCLDEEDPYEHCYIYVQISGKEAKEYIEDLSLELE